MIKTKFGHSQLRLLSGGLSLGREAQPGGQGILDQLVARAEAGAASAKRRRAAESGLGRHAQCKQGKLNLRNMLENSKYMVFHLIVDVGWVDFDLYVPLPCPFAVNFANFPPPNFLCPGIIGQTVEHSNLKSTQPSHRADGTPSILHNEYLKFGSKELLPLKRSCLLGLLPSISSQETSFILANFEGCLSDYNYIQ